MARFLAFRARFAGTIQDIASGCVIALMIAVALIVIP
jgi:hypothetical protein